MIAIAGWNRIVPGSTAMSSRHGEHSRQVDSDVAKMDSDRQWCRDHKADWDHDRFDIGVYFHK